MTPTISVIVPVYNVAKYVATCIDSIARAGSRFCATHVGCAFEIVAVDDGSSDGSGEILDRLVLTMPANLEMKVYHQPNSGVAKARQVGLDNSGGEYIAWVDPDDWVESDYYVRLYETAISTGADLVACDMMRDENEKSSRMVQAFDENPETYLRANVSGEVMGSLCNKLFKMDFIRTHNLSFPSSDCETMEDLYFICALLIHKPVLAYLPEAYYHYVYRKGSLITQPYSDRFVERWEHSIRLLESLLYDRGLEKLLYVKKADIKFGIYSLGAVSDKIVYGFCPEVKSLVGSHWPMHHRVLFWVVINLRCRKVVLMMLAAVRKLRKQKM